jgi:hypothetical protein
MERMSIYLISEKDIGFQIISSCDFINTNFRVIRDYIIQLADQACQLRISRSIFGISVELFVMGRDGVGSVNVQMMRNCELFRQLISLISFATITNLLGDIAMLLKNDPVID